MKAKRILYTVVGALLVIAAVGLAAACGGGGGGGTAAATTPATSAAAETGGAAATGGAETGGAAAGGALAGGLVTQVNVPGAGVVTANPADNTPDVLRKAIAAENWAFPVQFTDCNNSQVDPKGCNPPSGVTAPGVNQPGVYTPLAVSQIQQKWNICISFPHLKDAYWVASNYGGVAESQRDGLKMTLVEAGGYTNLPKQLSQIDDCVASGAQAVIIGAISYDGDNAELEKIMGQGVKVVDLINGVSSPQILAHSLITYYKMGYIDGAYLCSLNQPGIKVGWFPGPPGAGWVETSNNGFHDAIKKCSNNVTILDTKYGDTGKDVQLSLVQNEMNAQPDMNYIAGNAVAAEAAVGAVQAAGQQDKIKILADYMIPTTYDFIQKGQIACAPTDQNPMQVRIAVDQAVRMLQGMPFLSGFKAERVEPNAQLVCGPAAGANNNLKDFVYGATFAPPDFKPTFTVG